MGLGVAKPLGCQIKTMGRSGERRSQTSIPSTSPPNTLESKIKAPPPFSLGAFTCCPMSIEEGVGGSGGLHMFFKAPGVLCGQVGCPSRTGPPSQAKTGGQGGRSPPHPDYKDCWSVILWVRHLVFLSSVRSINSVGHQLMNSHPSIHVSKMFGKPVRTKWTVREPINQSCGHTVGQSVIELVSNLLS